jgi:hypothetical protein
VAIDQQKKGYGELVLIDAMQKTLNVSYNMGVAGLLSMQNMNRQKLITINFLLSQCLTN